MPFIYRSVDSHLMDLWYRMACSSPISSGRCADLSYFEIYIWGTWLPVLSEHGVPNVSCDGYIGLFFLSSQYTVYIIYNIYCIGFLYTCVQSSQTLWNCTSWVLLHLNLLPGTDLLFFIRVPVSYGWITNIQTSAWAKLAAEHLRERSASSQDEILDHGPELKRHWTRA